jgi:class 3 adenylate cyclase/streptogramin lyase
MERIDADLALGVHAELVGELEALVAEHPYSERLRAQLMLALYRSGRQADALEAYQEARHVLVDALGVEPSRDLRQLQQAILNQDVSLDMRPPRLGEPAQTEDATPKEELPSGTVTFLFTDIEGSTRLLHKVGQQRYDELLTAQQRILDAAFTTHQGRVVDTQGDSFFVAFRTAAEAVAAAVAAQRELATHDWPEGAEIKVRMGLHTGEPRVGPQRYVGVGVHRAARIGAAGHGGQVLLSSTTKELAEEELPAGVSIRDLGERRLKDFGRPERIFQLVVGGLPSEFAQLKTLDVELARKRRLMYAGSALIGVLAAAVAIPVFALGQGGSSGGSTAQSNSVAEIDPASNRVTRAVPVGDTPTSVAVGAGAVWVLNTNGESVSEIDPHSRAVVATFPVGAAPTDLAVGRGALWITTSSFDVVRLDPNTKIATTIRLPQSTNPAQGTSASWVGATGQEVWASGNGAVLRLVPTRLAVSFPGANCCNGIAVGGGKVWLSSDTGVIALDAATGREVGRVGLGFPGGRIAFGNPYLWVADPHGQQVWAIDSRTGKLGGSVTVGSQPDGIATQAGAVWVSCADGSVWRIDPISLHVDKEINVGGAPAGVAAGDGAVWVAVD